jgi:hypothetical protein
MKDLNHLKAVNEILHTRPVISTVFFIDRRSGILSAPRLASPDVENQVGMSTIFHAAKKRLLNGCSSAFFAVFCAPPMKKRGSTDEKALIHWLIIRL